MGGCNGRLSKITDRMLLAAVIVLLNVLGTPAFPQTSGGVISGQISDASGASIQRRFLVQP
jgi:hypothetical protein